MAAYPVAKKITIYIGSIMYRKASSNLALFSSNTKDCAVSEATNMSRIQINDRITYSDGLLSYLDKSVKDNRQD